jgi:protein TonB
MNVAQERPRSWTPHIILFSIVLHAVLIYYIAVAFQIVPLPTPPTFEPKTIETVRFDPKPPELPPERVEKQPRFRPRVTLPQPVAPTVQPLPLQPQPPTVSTANADTIKVDAPIAEQPVAQSLPSYPRTALERGIEGRVVMSITIMPDGSVRDVRVVNARPPGYFEAAAVRAVQTWRYRPSNVTRYNVIVHMDFELKDA